MSSSMSDYTPNTFLLLVPQVPFLFDQYCLFVDGSVTWDEMLLDTYELYKKICFKFEDCPTGIKIYPIFELPLTTTDQSLLIACIVGCLSFMEKKGKETANLKYSRAVKKDSN